MKQRYGLVTHNHIVRSPHRPGDAVQHELDTRLWTSASHRLTELLEIERARDEDGGAQLDFELQVNVRLRMGNSILGH